MFDLLCLKSIFLNPVNEFAAGITEPACFTGIFQIQFLNILGREVQIVVTQKNRSRKKAGLRVICP